MVVTTARNDKVRRMTAPKFFNRFVKAILRSPLHRIFNRKLMLITVRGRAEGP